MRLDTGPVGADTTRLVVGAMAVGAAVITGVEENLVVGAIAMMGSGAMGVRLDTGPVGAETSVGAVTWSGA